MSRVKSRRGSVGLRRVLCPRPKKHQAPLREDAPLRPFLTCLPARVGNATLCRRPNCYASRTSTHTLLLVKLYSPCNYHRLGNRLKRFTSAKPLAPTKTLFRALFVYPRCIHKQTLMYPRRYYGHTEVIASTTSTWLIWKYLGCQETRKYPLISSLEPGKEGLDGILV